jgi:Protein of unknown function (DUF2946)
MDNIVQQAMQKWPNVPACYGWLGLDRRGDWYLRDAATQAIGSFQSGVNGAKGSRLEHVGLRTFIERNYACDERGFWYFQNGPQRVYVELEEAPWIIRINADFSLQAHDGAAVVASTIWMDQRGWLFVSTQRGLGLVHSQDMVIAAEAIEALAWAVTPIPDNPHPYPQSKADAEAGPSTGTEAPAQGALAARFGFVLSPALSAKGRHK